MPVVPSQECLEVAVLVCHHFYFLADLWSALIELDPASHLAFGVAVGSHWQVDGLAFAERVAFVGGFHRDVDDGLLWVCVFPLARDFSRHKFGELAFLDVDDDSRDACSFVNGGAYLHYVWVVCHGFVSPVLVYFCCALQRFLFIIRCYINGY